MPTAFDTDIRTLVNSYDNYSQFPNMSNYYLDDGDHAIAINTITIDNTIYKKGLYRWSRTENKWLFRLELGSSDDIAWTDYMGGYDGNVWADTFIKYPGNVYSKHSCFTIAGDGLIKTVISNNRYENRQYKIKITLNSTSINATPVFEHTFTGKGRVDLATPIAVSQGDEMRVIIGKIDRPSDTQVQISVKFAD